MSLPPDSDCDNLRSAIVAALQANDIPAAIEAARGALDAGCESALFLNLRAHGAELEGRDADALVDLRRAHALDPADVSVLNALGLSLARNRLATDALATFDQVIARAPDFAPAYFNKGWVSEEAGELDAARSSFARAAALDPNGVEPRARLAALALRLGKPQDARQWALQALALDPRHPASRVALAGATFEGGDLAAAAELALPLAREPGLPEFERSQALGLIGDIRDAQGESAAAFAAWQARNETIRAANATRFARPHGDAMPQYLAWLEDYYAAFAPTQWLPSQEHAMDEIQPLRHVFVIGFPRCGTTLLEEVLARHPDAVTTQERDGLEDSVRDLMTSPRSLDRLAALGAGESAFYRRLYWQRLAAHGIAPGARIVVDKQPYNTVKLPLIARLFPQARVIFAIRDPRDVVLSCFRRRFRMNPSNYELLTLEGAARFYDAVMRLADLYRAKLPLALLPLRFEDLVGDLPRGIDALCAVLNIASDPAMLAFAERTERRAIVTPSAAQLAKGLNRAGMGAWRRYAAELAPVLPILAPWVAHWGYDGEPR